MKMGWYGVKLESWDLKEDVELVRHKENKQNKTCYEPP